jgi:predicted MarR family transcription regulator
MAVLEPILKFGHVIDGFTNRQVVKLTSRLLNEDYTTRQATYDLRRLRRKGLISRLSHKQRYQLTPKGRMVAVLFTKTHGRIIAPGLTAMDRDLPDEVALRSPLARAWRRFVGALDKLIESGRLAA